MDKNVKIVFDYVKTIVNVPTEVTEAMEAFKNKPSNVDKPAVTETGAAILRVMRGEPTAAYKSSEIAEALEVSTAKVSGAMLKLTKDGFVDKEKETEDKKATCIYTLTEKGKTFEI